MHGRVITKSNCSAISGFPEILQNMITEIHVLNICLGNSDDLFLSVLDRRKGKIMNGKIQSAFVDDLFPTTVEGVQYKRTVRVSTCEMLVSDEKCTACKEYRATLRSLSSRQKQQASTSTKRTDASSHVNFRYLSSPEKAQRFTNCSTKAKIASKELERLKKKSTALIANEGVDLNQSLHDDFVGIYHENTEAVHNKFPPGTFERLFWDQQAEVLNIDKRQIRWHPMMIKWCLNLKLLSSSAYSALRSTGVLTLPSERTLRDYTHFFKAGSGFSSDVDTQLRKEAQLESSRNSFVCLVFDEVKIKEDLIYDKHSGELLGFIDVGDVNNSLLAFQQSCESDIHKPQLATHMLVFMVCGILSALKYPYAQFPCMSVTADQLYSLVWGGVRRLEGAGFKVLAITCDGAASNRKFMKLHGKKNEFIHKTANPYSNEERPLFFISDVPHLIKTTRNCWSNSFAHSHSRTMWVSIMCF